MKLTKQIIKDILKGENNKSNVYIDGKKYVVKSFSVFEANKYEEVQNYRKILIDAGAKLDFPHDVNLVKDFLSDTLEKIEEEEK